MLTLLKKPTTSLKKKRVIHLTSAAQTGSGTSIDPFISSSAASSSSATGKPCDRCGYHSGLSGVISTCIDCFLGCDELCLFEYGVSIRYLLTKARGGTCTTASSDSEKVVCDRARHLLNKNHVVDYHLFSFNCKDFAIYCKTGQILSDYPLGTGNRIGHTILMSGATWLAFGISGPIGLACSLASSLHLSRLSVDLLRANSKKIPVEELVSRLQSR
ncbi:hypothetical protein SLE2022_149410 [Rubroshorea leprosula]